MYTPVTMNTLPLFLSLEHKRGVLRTDYSKPDPSGREVHYAVFRPDNWSVEENNHEAVLLAPGYTEGIEAMSRFATRLALHHGQTTVVPDHHRDRRRGELPQDHKEQTLRTAAEGYFEVFDGEMLELMAHSEGGIHATRFAAGKGNERTRSLTLVAPAGVVDQRFWPLALRTGRELIEYPLSGSLDLSQARHMGGYILRNPLLSLQEALSIPRTDVTPELAGLAEAGLPIGAVGFTRDRLIPAIPLRTSLPDQIPYRELDTDHVRFLRDPKFSDAVYDFHQEFAATPVEREAA